MTISAGFGLAILNKGGGALFEFGFSDGFGCDKFNSTGTSPVLFTDNSLTT